MRLSFLVAFISVTLASPSSEKLVARQNACSGIESFRLKQASTGVYGMYHPEPDNHEAVLRFQGAVDTATEFSLDPEGVLYVSAMTEMYAAIPKPTEFTGHVKGIIFPNYNPTYTPAEDYIPLTCKLSTHPGNTCALSCSVTTSSKPQTANMKFSMFYLYHVASTGTNDLWLGTSGQQSSIFRKAGPILVESA